MDFILERLKDRVSQIVVPAEVPLMIRTLTDPYKCKHCLAAKRGALIHLASILYTVER